MAGTDLPVGGGDGGDGGDGGGRGLLGGRRGDGGGIERTYRQISGFQFEGVTLNLSQPSLLKPLHLGLALQASAAARGSTWIMSSPVWSALTRAV